jgi:L-ascorbate metabolism protein UlaG (beta-lactamase superfamily)
VSKLTWLGGPTFLLELGQFKWLSDPMFGEGPAAFIMHDHPSTGAPSAEIARLAPLPPLDLRGLDGVIVSHLHSDHFDQIAADRLDKALTVIAAPEHTAVLNALGFHQAQPLGWWQTWSLQKNGETLTLTAVPARHAHADRLNSELGIVNGYLIDHHAADTGYRIYWTGDTVWFDDLTGIKAHAGHIDLLLPHLGAVGVDGPYGLMTLTAEDAVRVADLFVADAIIPIHHHTFSHYVESIEVFQAWLLDTPHEHVLHILSEGEALQLEPRKLKS